MASAVSIVVALLAAVVPLFLLHHFTGGLKWFDLPFLYVLVLAVVYLEASPSGALAGNSLPGVSERAGRYLLFQCFSLLLFMVPVVLVYCRVRPRTARESAPTEPLANKRTTNAHPFIVLLLGTTAVRVLLIAYYHLWRLRIGEVVAEVVVAVPTVPYNLLRLANEAVYPTLALAVWLVARDPRPRTRLLGWASIAVAAAFELLYAFLNSRYSVLLLFLALGLGYVQVRRPTPLFRRALVRRLVLVALVAYALGVGVLTLRGSSPGASQFNVVGDSQGLNRFNCADLVAQTELLPLRQDPSLSLWEGYTWTYRRFVDPAGFDKFRLSLQTTAKARLAQRYLGTKQLDYYSCTATDAVGVFGPLGLVLLALVVGLSLGGAARLLARGSPLARMIALWIVFHVVVFDQEFGTLLFSWPLVLPAVAGTAVFAWRSTATVAPPPGRPAL